MIDARGAVLVEMDEKARAAVVGLHRGIYPDPSKLTAQEKAEILRALDAETAAESVPRYPDKEAVRDRCRAMLGV